MNNSKNKNRTITVYAILAAALVISAVLSLALGSSRLTPQQVIGGIAGVQSPQVNVIIRSIRIPRLAAALVSGVGLSVAGALLQAVTDNDLASPNIIGVNSGAGFAVVLAMSLLPDMHRLLPFAAFAGAMAASMTVVGISSKISLSKSTVVLAGVALTTLFNAAISFVNLVDTDVMAGYSHFSVGGFSGVVLSDIALPAVLVALSLAVALLSAKRISLLCLGDSLAASLGVRVKTLRTVCLVCASLCAAAVVSFAGLLGFVGLVVPHIARSLVGRDTKNCLVTSALAGAVLVINADMLGRVVLAPTEIPVGTVMAFIGVPFFVYLLLGRKHNAADN